MKLSPFFKKLHYKVVELMSKSELVEKYLCASVTLEDGTEAYCIYCTIVRNAVIWFGVGFLSGLLL